MTHPELTERNRSTITAAFAGWRDGIHPIADSFAPQMTWRIEGRSVISADYATPEAFAEQVLAPFGRRFSADDPFRPVNVRGIWADGDTVIVLWDGRGTGVEGTVYENAYAWFLRMGEDRIVDGVAFFDAITLDAFWAQVAPAGSAG